MTFLQECPVTDFRKDAGPLRDRKPTVLHLHLSSRKSHSRPSFNLTTSYQ